MDQKFTMSETARKELEDYTETLKKVLKDKEKGIKDARDQLRQAKEAAIREYRDSHALIEELVVSYTDGFDDAVH